MCHQGPWLQIDVRPKFAIHALMSVPSAHMQIILTRATLKYDMPETFCDGSRKHARDSTPSASENPQVAAGGTKYLMLSRLAF